MKKMLREMTPAQLETMIQTANQPRLTVELPKHPSRSKGKKKLGRAPPAGKATRPLNSWMAFRSKYCNSSACEPVSDPDIGFYAPAFPKYQQKDISGFLTTIWQSDPFKAKWSILAKAYSVIRDSQGKDNTPLDQFLAMTGPLIGIIKAEYYLQAMGWEIAIDGSGQTVMNRYDIDIDEHLFVTNLSVNDIIRHCHHLGFVVGNVAESLSSENEAVMAMASSSQRTTASPFSIFGQTQGPGSQVQDGTTAASFGDGVYNSNGHHNATASVHEANLEDQAKGASATSTKINDAYEPLGAPQIAMEDEVSANSNSTYMTTNMTMETDSHPDNIQPESAFDLKENAEVTQQPNAGFVDINPASGLSAENFQLHSEYPFNVEFDPNLPGFDFDPFLGNQFDVFDISDFSWNDVIDQNICS